MRKFIHFLAFTAEKMPQCLLISSFTSNLRQTESQKTQFVKFLQNVAPSSATALPRVSSYLSPAHSLSFPLCVVEDASSSAASRHDGIMSRAIKHNAIHERDRERSSTSEARASPSRALSTARALPISPARSRTRSCVSRCTQLLAAAVEFSRSKTRSAFSKVDKKSSVPGAIGFERGPHAPPSAWYKTTAGVSPFFFLSPEFEDRL